MSVSELPEANVHATGNFLMNRPAKKLRHRLIEPVTQPIPKGDLNRGFGDTVAFDHTVHQLDGAVDIIGVCSDQCRRDVRINGGLNALGAFRAIAQTANRRAFAKTAVCTCIVAMDNT